MCQMGLHQGEDVFGYILSSMELPARDCGSKKGVNFSNPVPSVCLMYKDIKLSDILYSLVTTEQSLLWLE